MANSNLVFQYKPEGQAIPGQVTFKGYDDGEWCHAQNWSYGAHREVDSAEGATQNRERGTTTCTDLFLTRVCDVGSTALAKACFTGGPGPFVMKVLNQTKTGVDVLMTIECDEAIIADYTVNMGENDSGVASLSINYTEIRWKYLARNADGSAGKESKAGFNRTLGEAVA